ncbi:arginine--tRNA ligase, chloroplastic/mitochondrial [Artemisia annua]|uniref:arginine--tRNA ligase n=1 Tax=Artemisia annua TaxID=35608 RepID=A0A2U1LSW3_ARTAN|nr:arginine--tRNA ligase, chloroplastic/mitochondrial [Artemisia annua]
MEKTQDPDEHERLLDWSRFVNQTIIISYHPPHDDGTGFVIQVSNTYLTRWTISTSNNKDLQLTRSLIWEPFRARIPAPDERKRWSLQEEVTKPFEIAMKRLQREIKQNVPEISYPGRYPDLTQEHRMYTSKREPGHYECRNALWIWAELIDCLTSSKSDEGPKYVGEKIKEEFPKESYDMIEGRPSINRLGFVTIELSGKWIAKASKLILEKDKGWETGEERVLGFHLLEFTEALEESCLSIMPHILCEYLYDLCKKFNRYHSSMCKDGFVVETSTLLLYEATEVVIEKCFHLLGILPGSSLFGYSMTQLVSGLLFSAVERPIDVYARDPTRNFRFEMVCFRSIPVTPLWLDHEGELFGLISVSDKIVPSRSHFFETDVTSHVPLFNHDWRNPIKNLDSNCVYLGNPASGYSVSFSYFIEICAELYVTNKNECYQLCNHKKEIDLSSFWENSDGVCGELTVNAKHGYATMYYILLKDAIDTALKVEFKTEPDTPPRLVRGYIQAYYGDEFLYKCQSGSICKECYMAVLFQAAPSYVLTAGYIPLIKSFLGVPTKGSLIIKAYLQDVDSNKVIIDGTSNFKPQLYGCNRGTITGSEDCSLNIEVSWNYQDRYI